jgi:hypothetical protein
MSRRQHRARPHTGWNAGAPRLGLLLAVLVLACGDRVTAPATTDPENDFSALELRTIGGIASHAFAVDQAGVVAGWSSVNVGHAVIWDPAGDAEILLSDWSSTRGMNAEGSIVGWSRAPTGRQGAYARVDGQHRVLVPLDPGHHAHAWTINADRIVAGVSNGWAVLWEPQPDGSYSAPRNLGLHRLSNADGAHINARGDVAFTAEGTQCCEVVLWRRKPDGGYGEPFGLGRVHPGPHYARGINDAGIVVGYRWSGTQEIAVAWLPTDYSQPVDLGPGQAWHINNHNQVVGTSGGELAGFNLETVQSRPALWLLNGAGGFTGPLDLGTPSGYEWAAARFISDSGWIAGSTWGPGVVAAARWRLPSSLRSDP